MSTWQIFSDAENTFRWEVSGQKLRINPDEESRSDIIQKPSSNDRLPSMTDLLLQECPKLIENGHGDGESPPMFRTGLGKSIVVKQSSISKALSIFSHEDHVFTDSGCSKLTENGDGNVESSPMFRTGLGKSVAVKQSSISKALSILGDEADAVTDAGQSRGRRKSCSISNSMLQTGLIKTTILSDSMFHTGSGKAVNISSAGLTRARALLGLEENCDDETVQGFEQRMKQSTGDESFGWKSSSNLDTTERWTNIGFKDAISVPSASLNFKFSSFGSELRQATSGLFYPSPSPPPIKFHTAGGRSISVSSSALECARSLLGDPELATFLDERDTSDSIFLFSKDKKSDDNSLNKENGTITSFTHQEKAKSGHLLKNFISPIRPTSNKKKSSAMLENASLQSNLIKKFDAEAYDTPTGADDGCDTLHAVKGNLLANGCGSSINPPRTWSGRPLVDISNNIGLDHMNKHTICENRERKKRSYISPFKRPRNAKFISPLESSTPLLPSGLSILAPEASCTKRRVCTRYPFQAPRKYFKEYLGVPQPYQKMLGHLPDFLRKMNPVNAQKFMFHDEFGSDCIGMDVFGHMLTQSGASMQCISKEWIANHYKWIVWKLACFERCYPTKSSGGFLTVSNVFEELRYRYEREVNYGHRSAIKRILEGDAPASSMLVLCISSIHSNCEPNIESHSTSSNNAENCTAATIELTDGWYSINAFLDVILLKMLAAGKLFVGQKLRIWGAGLCGWVGPVSPLEASKTVSLLLHINGTYRAHWADRLGFCKGHGAPLAFRCIKGTGGAVPSTLVGVTRIYPVLYRERLSSGGFIVRSHRMEARMMELHTQRQSMVVESVMTEFQRGAKDMDICNDLDSEEGATLLKLLETTAEPEVLMAGMSSEQLNSFTTYQAKLEAIRQSNMQKSIEKALEDAGLTQRDVTPFMRVRVVGLTRKGHRQKHCSKKGLITIWNPTQKQQSELAEGKAYAIVGLVPLSSDSDTLYLQTRGSASGWLPLTSSEIEQFEPFFSPRRSTLLSNMGEVPLSSEFDIAALVVYVGAVYIVAHQKKQWVFVTDASVSASREPSNSLLAISFCLPCTKCDSFVPINHNLAGSTVGFCNLIKKAKDHTNHIWVAEATENSSYILSYDHVCYSHLKDAAASTQRWANNSSMTMERLREKILSIIGNCKS